MKNVANVSRAIIAQNNANASRAFPLFFILSSGDLCISTNVYSYFEAALIRLSCRKLILK